MHTYAFINTYIHTYKHTHTHTHIYIYIYITFLQETLIVFATENWTHICFSGIILYYRD